MQLESTYVEATLIYLSIHNSRGDPAVDLIIFLVVAERFSEHGFVPEVSTKHMDENGGWLSDWTLAREWRNRVSLKPFHRRVRATHSFGEHASELLLTSSDTGMKI